LKKFLFLTDLHYGFERRSGHKSPLHDPRAMAVALEFAHDFQPDTLILGGDILDCGAISHHNRNKPGRTEGLRLLADANDCRADFIEPLTENIKASQRIFITGNHEDWLNDVTDEQPGLEGLLGIGTLLGLDGWNILPQGGYYNLGKLTFLHGDQLSGGEHVAKAAVTSFERSVRFGHHHTYQVYTKTTPVDTKLGKTGIACPCLCTRSPKYGESKPNRWVQGVNYGYVFPDGSYHDFVSLIVNGRMLANGKVYKS
jgi:UDP-2,3-diacylglucosamine pyrophosphatase LpxH